MANNKKGVAASATKAVAVPDDIDLVSDAGDGGDTMDNDDLIIPVINIV